MKCFLCKSSMLYCLGQRDTRLHLSSPSHATPGMNPRAAHMLRKRSTEVLHSHSARLSTSVLIFFIGKMGKMLVLGSGCGHQLRLEDFSPSQASWSCACVRDSEGMLTNTVSLLLYRSWISNLRSKTKTQENRKVCIFNAETPLESTIWKTGSAVQFSALTTLSPGFSHRHTQNSKLGLFFPALGKADELSVCVFSEVSIIFAMLWRSSILSAITTL